MAHVNLQEVHDTLVSVAFEAGRMILAADVNDISKGEKLNSVDIVTEVDQAVEKMVSTRLRAAYPTFAFIGEETFQKGVTKVTTDPTFIVDPIDGTTNFIHGFPWACISLGFVLDRSPSVGVVYCPFLDTLYTGIRGKGSFVQRNAALARDVPDLPESAAPRQRLPLSGKGDAAAAPPLAGLGAALAAVEWGNDREGANFDLKARVFRELAASRESGGRMVQNIRSLGSAALNLCIVAAGQLDLYWEGGCWAWDVAAGWCILEEAGGIMASSIPGDWKPEVDERNYFAVRGAPAGQKEIVEEFWAVVGEGKLVYEH